MKTFKYSVLILAVLGIINPYQVVVAQKSPTAVEQAVCPRIETIEQSMLVSMETKRKQGISIETNVDRQALKERLTQARSQADGIRAKHFELIINKLTNPSQKQAVEKYQTSLTSAINDRRNTIDTAQDNYIDKVVDLLKNHKQSVTRSEDTMVSDVRQAFVTTKAICINNSDDQTARTKLVEALNLAKSNFAARKQALEQDSFTYKQLTQDRNQVIIDANNLFKQSELRAKQQLLKDIVLNR